MGGVRYFAGDTRRYRQNDLVGKAYLQSQLASGERGIVTNADDLQPLFKGLADTRLPYSESGCASGHAEHGCHACHQVERP